MSPAEAVVRLSNVRTVMFRLSAAWKGKADVPLLWTYRTMPDRCPKCKSKLIGGLGIGTEKLEEEIKKLFPRY